jgi:hypothetical protein
VETTVRASPSDLPASAIDACAAATARQASTARPNALEGRTPATPASPSASPFGGQVLCRASSGELHLWPGGAETCAAHAMTRVRG